MSACLECCVYLLCGVARLRAASAAAASAAAASTGATAAFYLLITLRHWFGILECKTLWTCSVISNKLPSDLRVRWTPQRHDYFNLFIYFFFFSPQKRSSCSLETL